MALKNDFYSEIFEQEQKWIELIKSNLLNSVYCNLTLKPFYLEKKNQLEQQYYLTHNEIIGNIIVIIDSILEKIDLFNEQFKSGQHVDVYSLLPLFLTTQMSNTSKKEENSTKIDVNQEINDLQVKKSLLESKIRNFDRNIYDNNDYIYEDFPEEARKVK